MEAYTKYEKARIIGARALQLAMNAPILISMTKEKLEDINYDPLKIAEIEFNASALPITVKRPFPKKEEELKEETEEEIIKEEEEVVEKKEEAEEVPEEKEIKKEEAAEAPEIEADE